VSGSRYDVTRLPDTPRNRLEAEQALGAARAADPERADRYAIRFDGGGYFIVRLDPK
jgi:hypothetical protein